jgi:MoxR-like ATPase
LREFFLNNKMSETHSVLTRLGQALSMVIVGQSTLVQQLLIALLAGGHIILEGVPGTGKTLLVKVLAQLIQAEFRRIQLTGCFAI